MEELAESESFFYVFFENISSEDFAYNIRPPTGWEFMKENKKLKKKHAFDQESDKAKKKKNDNGQEKKKENTLSTKKVIFKKKKDNDQEKRRKEMEIQYSLVRGL